MTHSHVSPQPGSDQPQPSGAGLSVRLRQSAPIPLDAAFDCASGEVLALVGPSGSGKSTLLRMIAGLVDGGEGVVRCGGETWLDTATGVGVPARRRRVGFVFQSYALFPHLSALDNVLEACDPGATRVRREALARSLLGRVRLTGLEDRRPAELSGGQQQRVAVARALAREPKVLLLDEPFSAVDRATRERLYQELAQLRAELGMPVVLVTHDLDEAMLLADRLCVLSRGRTLQVGEPDQVQARPCSVEVARLLGHRNLFRAQVLQHDAAAGHSVVEWRGRRLLARLQPGFAEGAQVCWVVPSSQVIVHRSDRPPGRERPNTMRGTVETMVRMGAFASLAIRSGESTRAPLFAAMPLHSARRIGLADGSEVTLSIAPDAIQLVPPDEKVADG
jgi:molybdate transport system ATP-binding protein